MAQGSALVGGEPAARHACGYLTCCSSRCCGAGFAAGEEAWVGWLLLTLRGAACAALYRLLRETFEPELLTPGTEFTALGPNDCIVEVGG